MADKEFKTIDEQLEILRSRGLNIPDESSANEFLLRNNYYRVSGYSLTLRKNDVFSKYATFQNIEDIYNFDHQLRHIILKYIDMIEVQFKSIYAYEFTKVHGPIGYLSDSFFTNIKLFFCPKVLLFRFICSDLRYFLYRIFLQIIDISSKCE